jgi:hypothetical protein
LPKPFSVEKVQTHIKTFDIKKSFCKRAFKRPFTKSQKRQRLNMQNYNAYYSLSRTKGTKAQALAVNLADFDKTAKESERIILFYSKHSFKATHNYTLAILKHQNV